MVDGTGITNFYHSWSDTGRGAGGGGATHIALRTGVLSSIGAGNLNSILIVAGGGGGRRLLW